MMTKKIERVENQLTKYNSAKCGLIGAVGGAISGDLEA